ncbi:hypothetical protein [Chryseobacterium caseinilyticum]|uniref:Cardiolipin synthase N-terminal domain-containing protein n=1 Tax=Chryseobacterium caseinilyticum TaxID=2771428 RepID=A0ABR8ZC71_9FLAO|nr:hypothetical protein [Chryseobacterium caseinilyticum]MBD8082848.1 hypothetical protein [Chryseobacterium caseinilyticum]
MESKSQKKNNPNIWIIVLISLIPLTIVVYFILQMVFPNLFQTMPTGEVQPLRPDQ